MKFIHQLETKNNLNHNDSDLRVEGDLGGGNNIDINGRFPDECNFIEDDNELPSDFNFSDLECEKTIVDVTY
ncbi:hypothetical protein [Oceanobacillus alkalisoli]|uniref:hypothetical protein n=1 Tax=Oceanobacillus alkalisoli TaxID=2925113 RepID=UPI001EF03D64|nr:hypothetical protein [Oceanobacillus alkalisoli]MCF3943343.1 hypothetical protein [Oceanobacillus alkalisoli]MCG5105284.1 hypothetical protein [Oceanobacillus alkalisoli]